jgi:hypothetical protein
MDFGFSLGVDKTKSRIIRSCWLGYGRRLQSLLLIGTRLIDTRRRVALNRGTRWNCSGLTWFRSDQAICRSTRLRTCWNRPNELSRLTPRDRSGALRFRSRHTLPGKCSRCRMRIAYGCRRGRGGFRLRVHLGGARQTVCRRNQCSCRNRSRCSLRLIGH